MDKIKLEMTGEVADILFSLLYQVQYKIAQPIVDDFKAQIAAQQGPKLEE